METQAHDLEDILRKVQALIAKADSTQEQFPQEAASFRAKAEALMIRYRLEESMLAEAAPTGTLEPVWKDWRICKVGNEFSGYYQHIAASVLHHVGGRGVFKVIRDSDGSWFFIECVGYESDLRYGEMLLTSALLAFGEHLEPSYDPNQSDQFNAYRMRKAGMEGWRIAYLLWGQRLGLQATPGSVGRNAGKARRLYAVEARLRGENPNELMGQGTNVQTYRQSYAEGFTSEIASRLYRMRIDSGADSQAIILMGRKDAVNETFYERYPEWRPTPIKGDIGDGRYNCPNCAKNKSGSCRRHPKLPAYKDRPYNSVAAMRGQRAASTVDLGTTGRITS